MKVFTQLARRLGIVRASHYRVAIGKQRKAEARLAALLGESEKLRAAVHAWKHKAEALSGALKQSQAYAKRLHHDAERARQRAVAGERDALRIRQLERTIERADERNTLLQTELEALARRFEEADRDLKIARENLMVVEVKLDILEGAAGVLDRRTRVDGVRQSTSGTPV